MGAGYHGGFGHTSGKGSNVDDNAEAMKDFYPLTANGYFGEKGKNTRVIKTPTPEATSVDFYQRLGEGGRTEMLSNGKGTKTILDDGTIIVHRLVTTTPNSPAVDIKVIHSSTVKKQKVHFIKENN